MIKKLLSIRLKSTFLGSLTGKNKKGNANAVSGAKIAGFALLYAFLGLFFAGSSFSVSMGLGIYLVPQGAADFYFGLFSLIVFTVLFVLSIFETKSELFECKDNELLLSMPIRPRDIIISRIFTVLIINYGVAAVLILPAIAAFMICGGSPLGIFGGLYLLLTLPLLATVLASAAGYFVAIIAAKIKSKNIVSVLLSVIFLGIYFAVYFGLIGKFEEFMENGDEIVNLLKEKAPLLAVIGKIALFVPVNFAVYTGLTLLATFIAIALISKNYVKIITRNYSAAKKVYKAKRTEQKSAFAAISKKEFARFWSSANYILNGGIGVLFAIALTVFAAIGAKGLFESSDLVIEGFNVSDIRELAVSVGVGVVIFFFSMNSISASALSLEGDSLWIIKSIPVSERDILLAKAAPSIMLNSPVAAVCGLVLAISFEVSPIYYVFYILTPVSVTLLFSLAGLLLNVAFPKFVFVNEVQVVKQSLAVFLTLTVCMLFSFIILAILFVGGIFGAGIIANAVVLALSLILNSGCCLMLIGPASRKFSRISV